MKDKKINQHLYLILAALFVLLWMFAYAVPRMSDTKRLQQESADLIQERRSITNALAAYAELPVPPPLPTPNTVSWISKNALKGLDNHLECNNPYSNGKGAQVKLRAIKADQASAFLSELRTVNLMIKSIKLEDTDGDGRWNLEVMVEAPQ